MAKRIPASMRTREALQALIEGRLASAAGRSELVELATRLIVEEALEGEVRDTLDRGYYERGHAPGQGHRNGHRTHRLKSAEGGLEYSAPQVAGLERPFRSALRDHLKGHTEALESLAVEMLARGLSARYIDDASRTRPGGCCCRRQRFAKSASSSRGLQAFKSIT
jgi:putative transposase